MFLEMLHGPRALFGEELGDKQCALTARFAGVIVGNAGRPVRFRTGDPFAESLLAC
jgi:hypothetical protein